MDEDVRYGCNDLRIFLELAVVCFGGFVGIGHGATCSRARRKISESALFYVCAAKKLGNATGSLFALCDEGVWLLLAPAVGYGPEDGIQRGVQMFSEVLGEKPEDMAAVFLKQCVFAAITAVSVRIG